MIPPLLKMTKGWQAAGIKTVALISTGILAGFGLTVTTTMPFSHALVWAQQQQQDQQQPIVARIQNTSMSKPAPNAQLNNQTLLHNVFYWCYRVDSEITPMRKAIFHEQIPH